jgi:hypothetical protein
MRFVLALNSLGIGGTESYILTVAEYLDRLGHDAVVYTPEPGRGVEVANEQGTEVIDRGRLGSEFDVAIVQDSVVSYELAQHSPSTPQIFVGHSDSFAPQGPPQLPDLVSVAVALNDRVERRLLSAGIATEVLRLRQPIDLQRFRSRGALPDVPKRALLLSNNLVSDRLEMIEAHCEAVGIELARRGGSAGQTTDPRADLAAADFVIGNGRSILEAMALGRAAYVYDHSGGDGWVTTESYSAIEAQGFAGRTGQVIDAERFAADLPAYSPSMGPVNRDLITAHHRANAHVDELVRIAGDLTAAPPRPRAPLEEMARLVRLEWRARAEVHGLLGENANLRAQLGELHEQRAEDARALQRAQEAELAAAHELADTIGAYEATVSWRATRPLRAVTAWLKRLRSR